MGFGGDGSTKEITHYMGYFIRENLKRIRNRKSKKYKNVSIFGCLTREVKSEESLKKPYFPQLSLKKLRKLEQRRKSVDSWYEEFDVLFRNESRDRLQNRRFRKLEKRLFVLKLKKDSKVRTGRKQRKPRRFTYEVYIKSPLWTSRKNKLFQDRGKFCNKCESVERVSVHHLRYNQKEFGKEKDTDLVALCWKCHHRFHEIYGVKKDSHEDYKLFIKLP